MILPLIVGLIILLPFIMYAFWLAAGWYGVLLLVILATAEVILRGRDPQKNSC